MTKNTQTASVETTALLTPYAAAKLANAVFAENDIKAVPPQMMYNYTTSKVNAGKKPLIAYTAETGVDRDDLQRWIDSYIAKKVAKANKVAEELVSTDAS